MGTRSEVLESHDPHEEDPRLSCGTKEDIAAPPLQAGYAGLATVLFGAWVSATSAFLVRVPSTSGARHASR